MNRSGALLCARYAVAPNFFGYCGPDKNKELLDYLKENDDDGGVPAILSDFETLYPYLMLIARENNIVDPFSSSVVEAYWLGNDLLRQFDSSLYISLLEEKLQLKNKLNKELWGSLKNKLSSLHPFPHHTFHVFNIFRRTGRDSSFQTLATMDACRIGWGRVIEAKDSVLTVKTKSLIFNKNKLMLGKDVLRQVGISYRHHVFLTSVKSGDWVSFHWGFVCDVVTERQIKNLNFYTTQAINFYNS